MEKVIKDNKVAVLYSPGYGAGWSTWNDKPELVFDPVIVNMLLDAEDRPEQSEEDLEDRIMVYLTLKYNDCYFGGVDTLTIKWVPIGSQFRITEYDGSETVEIRDSLNWLTA